MPHDGERLHSALMPSRRRPLFPLGLNLGKYIICYSRILFLPQSIRDVKQGKYNLILFTETNIPYAV